MASKGLGARLSFTGQSPCHNTTSAFLTFVQSLLELRAGVINGKWPRNSRTRGRRKHDCVHCTWQYQVDEELARHKSVETLLNHEQRAGESTGWRGPISVEHRAPRCSNHSRDVACAHRERRHVALAVVRCTEGDGLAVAPHEEGVNAARRGADESPSSSKE